MSSESNLFKFQPSKSRIADLSHRDDQISSDVELWRAFRNEDEAAFIQLYNQYANVLFNYGRQFCPDREMVKDCLQDFFIYLRKNRAGFNDTSSIKMYLFKAFRRRIIDYLKRYDRECRNSKDAGIFRFSVELSSENIYINNQLEEEQIGRLNKALKMLDKKEREAIYYFYYEGLSYEQIGEVFHFSHVSSARRLIYRGLGHLRKLILFYFLSMISISSIFRI